MAQSEGLAHGPAILKGTRICFRGAFATLLIPESRVRWFSGPSCCPTSTRGLFWVTLRRFSPTAIREQHRGGTAPYRHRCTLRTPLPAHWGQHGQTQQSVAQGQGPRGQRRRAAHLHLPSPPHVPSAPPGVGWDPTGGFVGAPGCLQGGCMGGRVCSIRVGFKIPPGCAWRGGSAGLGRDRGDLRRGLCVPLGVSEGIPVPGGGGCA